MGASEDVLSSNVVESLFQAGGELSPCDEPFSGEVYRDFPTGRLNLYGSTNFVPQVISSPKLTGKTTQLNFIAGNQERFSGPDEMVRVNVVLPVDRQLSEAELRQMLADSLKSKYMSTVRDLIESSEIVLSERGRKVLAIINADNLEEAALKWLLSGVRALVEESEPLLSSQIQIVVDGSFSVETLTAGADSEFPIPQIYPREFTESEQKRFVEARLGKINILLGEESLRSLFSVTGGDKYLTQAICLYIARELDFPDEPVAVSEESLRSCFTKFVHEDPQGDELVRSVVECVTELINEGLGVQEAQELICNIGERWREITPGLRSILYKGGVVRRVGEKNVELRAPLVLDIVRSAGSRLCAVREIIDANLNLEGVADDQLDDVLKMLSKIEKCAIKGTLTSLHVGFGKRLGPKSVGVEAMALGKGEYQAKLDIELRDTAIGGDVWVILWGHEVDAGGRNTELRFFKVRNPLDVSR